MANQEMLVVNMAKQYDLDPETFKRTIKATCGLQNARDEEFLAFLIVAHEQKLNPLAHEIYAFVKSGGGIQPIMGVDGWIKKMDEHPAFNGVEFSEQIDGNGQLLSITCTIHRKDRTHPTVVTEYLHECRRNTEPWRQMPARMLRHRSLVQCIRIAFNLAGIMDPDEAERFQEILSKQPEQPTHEDLPVGSTGKVRPNTGTAAGSAGAGTEAPRNGDRKKAQERSAPPTSPPPRKVKAEPEEPPISSERQKDLVEQGDLVGMKSSQINQYAMSKYGVALNKITPSQADEIEQYLKTRAVDG